MEKTVNKFRTTFCFTLLATVLMIGGCSPSPEKQIESQKSPDFETKKQSTDVSPNDSRNEDLIKNFLAELTSLQKELQSISVEQSGEVYLSGVIKTYNVLLSQEEKLIQPPDKAIFNALNALKFQKLELNQTSGDEVKELQDKLVQAKYLILADGAPDQFGPSTLQALESFFERVKSDVEKLNSGTAPESSESGKGVLSDPQKSIENNKMPFDLLSSLLGLVTLVVLGGLVFKIWQLSQQVEFLSKSFKSRVDRLDQRLQKKESEYNKIFQNIQYLDQKVIAQDQKVSSVEYSVRQQKSIGSEPQNYGSGISSLSRDMREDRSQYAQIQSPHVHTQSRQNNPIRQSSSLPLELANQYNQSPGSLAQSAIGVSQTEDSLNLNLRDSSNTNVILAKDPSPNYWIVQDSQSNSWLFPREGWEPSIGTIESFGKLFKSTGDVSRRFQVKRPALVIATSQNEWSLQEMGEVEFS